MGKYDDIINREYVKSSARRHMTMAERAAQFGAFKALSGHEEALHETARLTDEKTELDEYAKQELSGRLNFLAGHIDDKPAVTVRYFTKDDRKSGGFYQTAGGVLSKIKDFERVVVVDGIEIPIDDILTIESEIIDNSDEFYE
ncbi:MAG: hypothetical protein J6N52_08375 [Clostridia bacterium]|nr:hypothetical protein [Clostridia bacterium]